MCQSLSYTDNTSMPPQFSDPVQKLVFLCIEIDTVQNCLMLSRRKKVSQTVDYIKCTLDKKRLSRKHLEILTGKLIWACNTQPHSQAFMNTMSISLRQLKVTK